MYNGPNRKKLRLKDFNYSEDGYYFVTICTKNKECYFGDIVDGSMILNKYGEIAEKEILKTPELRREIIIDKFVIMPNHIHILIIISNLYDCDTHDCRVRLQSYPTNDDDKGFFGIRGAIGLKGNNLSSIIRGLKGSITNQINSTPKDFHFQWQKSFHDVIIRNEEQFIAIQQYIIDNPLKWELDKNNPDNL